MAIRNIRVDGDEILRKECKPIKLMTPRMRELIGDMFETMYAANGVGLAAPQVGVLKRIFVVDIDNGKQYVFINPEIVERSEETQTGAEGCLSIPGKQGTVTRPLRVKIKALDENMKPFELTAEEFLARAICHENDHLHGVLYKDLAEGELVDVSELEEAEEEQE